MTNNLRSSLIRLAHTNPDLRPHLLPLLKEAGCEKQEEGESKTATVYRNVFLQDAAGKMTNSWGHLNDALNDAQNAASTLKQSGLMMDHSDVEDLYVHVKRVAMEIQKAMKSLKGPFDSIDKELIEVSGFYGG